MALNRCMQISQDILGVTVDCSTEEFLMFHQEDGGFHYAMSQLPSATNDIRKLSWVRDGDTFTLRLDRSVVDWLVSIDPEPSNPVETDFFKYLKEHAFSFRSDPP